ncbi:MAG: hypothetical protein EZS28_033485, partial [Streblomastix strix]
MKPGFIIPEVMAWFTGQHRTPKSSLNKQSRNKTMQQLIFDRELMHDTLSVLTYRAISNCSVVTRKYAHIGIEGFTAYSIKHASTTKLAAMGIQERDLNMFTNHAPDSKSARNYYVFAANRQ